MIPSLRDDGTLPPGIHQATLEEVLAAYPAANEQRRILNDSLRCAVEELRKLDPSVRIFVDGSYITDKAEPNDVDLLIVTSRYDTLTLLNHLDMVCPVAAVSLSIYVEPQEPNTMLDFFMTTRMGQPKGIIVVG